MVRQKQLHDGLAGVHHAGGVRLDVHAVGYREGAARSESALPFDLDYAHTARAAREKVFHVAESGDMNPRPFERGEDGFTLFGFYRSIIYINGYHLGPRYSVITALKRQTSTQVPQPMHLSGTI